MNPKVFVSYSRKDRHIVTPLVELLRLRGDLVFFDVDSISPGQLWRDELETAIESASWFVLFWCEHSSQSREVEREFRAALSLGKKIVPLILDDTLLPSRISAFQGIDFRAIEGLHPKGCDTHTSDPFAPFALPTPTSSSPASLPTDHRPHTRPPTRIPDDYDPFADISPPAPITPQKSAAGTPSPAVPSPSLDVLFGLGQDSAARPSEDALLRAADTLLSFLSDRPK